MKLLRTEEDYKKALARFEEIFQAKEGTEESDEAGVLSLLINDYEKKHYPIQRIPFISDVELFNKKFGRLVNEVPTLPSKEEVDFIYNFILEEAKEMKIAYEQGDVVGVLDAILDQLYVGVGLATMSFGLRDKIQQGFNEVQRSNMTKYCKTEVEAKLSVVKRSKELNEACHYEQVGDIWIVFRTRDRKIIKPVSYSPPDLKQFFTEEEINNSKILK